MSQIFNTTNIRKLDFYNVINVYYAYDYANDNYERVFTYPESDALNHSFQLFDRKRALDVKMPFVYSQTVAEAWAKKYYEMWSYGVTYATWVSPFGDYASFTDSPYVGEDLTDKYKFVVVKKYLNWGESANNYNEGYLLDVDNEDLWNW